MVGLAGSWLDYCRRSIRYRLTAWSVLLLAVALLVNTLIGSIYSRAQIHRAAAELQSEIAATAARQVQSFVARKIERLEDLGAAMSLSPMGSDGQRSLALLLLKNDSNFSELAVLHPDGKELLKFSEARVDSPANLTQQSATPPYHQAASGKTYVGPVYTSDRAEPLVTIAVPIKSSPRKVIGILIAKVNLKFLWDIFAEIHFGKGGFAYLIDEKANLIAHHDPSMVLKKTNLKDLPKVRAYLQKASLDTVHAQEGLGINGKPALSTYASVPELGWAVVVEEPVELALADLSELQRYGGLLLLVGLLVGAGAIVWITGKITRPIQTLRAGVAVIGDGNLDHRVAITSSDEIGQLASEFNHMAEVLSGAYATLEQKVEQRTRQVAALYDVTKTVNQSLALDRVLQEVVERITQIFHFDTTRVYLLDSKRENLIARAYFENDAEPWTGIQRFEPGRSVVGHVVATGKAIVFADVQSDPRYEALTDTFASRQAGCHFLAMLPIKIQDSLLGAMSISGKETRVLADEEMQLLTSMCEHIAVAVEKGNLFEQVKTRSRHLEVLNTIGAAIGQSLNLDEVLDQAVDKIAKNVGFHAAWIYQFSDRDGLLHMKAFHGLSDDMASSMATREPNVGTIGHVLATGESLVFEDISNDDRYHELSRGGTVASLGFASAGAFSIKAKEKIIGTLHVANRSKRHFSADEIELIQSLANQIGVATVNAMLFNEVNEKTKELAKTNQDLVDATRAKSEFIAAMSHELRTPLNIVIGSSDLLRDGFFGEIADGQKDATDKISRNARVLLKMINDVLTISQFEAARISLDVSTVEVDDVIEQARAMVEQINRDKHLEVRWQVDPSVPPLMTDSLKLEEILQNLIGNAFKFTPKGYIEVRVNNRPDQDRVEFTVADTGIGIAVEDQAKIFNAFEQLKDAHTGHFNGVGLGLNIVRRYLDLMQGEISVESQPGQGSKFTFSVPRSLQ
jgi:signal transduction histidine kinase